MQEAPGSCPGHAAHRAPSQQQGTLSRPGSQGLPQTGRQSPQGSRNSSPAKDTPSSSACPRSRPLTACSARLHTEPPAGRPANKRKNNTKEKSVCSHFPAPIPLTLRYAAALSVTQNPAKERARDVQRKQSPGTCSCVPAAAAPRPAQAPSLLQSHGWARGLHS